MSPVKPAPAAKAPSQKGGQGDLDRPADGLLDAAAIRRLRLQAGYSTRRFARALGVSASTVRGLEDGSNHEQLPLTLIARLAELVGVTTRELFVRATDEPADPSTDDRIIEAALQSLPGVVAASDLARALGWKLERTRRALDALDRRLQPTGARLHRNGWQQYAIRPSSDHLSDQQQQALHRIGPRDRGLNHITARLLLAATRGELDDRWFKTASNSERVALQSLLKQGALITLAGETQIIPATETVYGLDPYLRDQPALDELRPSGGLPPFAGLRPVERQPEDHPTDADAASATEELVTPD